MHKWNRKRAEMESGPIEDLNFKAESQENHEVRKNN